MIILNESLNSRPKVNSKNFDNKKGKVLSIVGIDKITHHLLTENEIQTRKLSCYGIS
jgi:hypothetical protein